MNDSANDSGDRLERRKSEHRKVLRAARDLIPPDERNAAADAVAERLAAEAARLGARTVMVFLSLDSEIPTASIIARLHADGIRVAVPVIVDGEVVPFEFAPGDPVVTADYGIEVPAERRPVPEAELDVVAAPGLGFDRQGRRVGYGGGFYDRLLGRVRPDALRIGIGFHSQLIDEVPTGPKDHALDMVITERETIPCRTS